MAQAGFGESFDTLKHVGTGSIGGTTRPQASTSAWSHRDHDPSPLARFLIWLSGAGAEALSLCPEWERRKYMAFGATVLVPTSFGFLACSYALSTLATPWYIILPVALVWSGIILTIDRALLAIYRAYSNFFRKILQFFLRILVAILMGATIAHPLTLLIFRDTITSEVERERRAEIEAVEAQEAVRVAEARAQITPIEEQIAAQRQAHEDTFRASFLDQLAADGDARPSVLSSLDQEVQDALEARISEATAPYDARLALIETQLTENEGTYATLQSELDHWQREFERELDGQRSGLAGLGPRAKSIQSDHLEWRRSESQRLGSIIESLTSQRTAMESERTRAEQLIVDSFQAEAAQIRARREAEQARLDGLRQQIQESQATQFVSQQELIRQAITAQIATLQDELKRANDRLDLVVQEGRARVQAIQDEPRRDILTQTLALHHIFDSGSDGGLFALTAYIVLVGLFMLVDTIPLVVKFFTKAGPYDTLIDQDEIRYDKEREAFVRSYRRYMDQLGKGRFLAASQDPYVRRALLEGHDHTQASVAYLESLAETEKSFHQSVKKAQQEVAQEDEDDVEGRAAMLDRMYARFREDLDEQVDGYFRKKRPQP